MKSWLCATLFAATFIIAPLSLATSGCSTVGTAAEGTGDVAGQAIEDTGRAAGHAVEGTGDVIRNTAEKAEDEMH
jgi:hypothetical protein